jgi:hypothetical protein
MEAEPVGLTGSLSAPDPSVEIEKVAAKEVASYTLFGWLYIPILWIRTLFTGSSGTESARCLYDLSEFDDVR